MLAPVSVLAPSQTSGVDVAVEVDLSTAAALDEDEILQSAQGRLERARRFQETELHDNWSSAYGYYYGERPGPSDCETSDVVSTDVSEVVEWLLPAIMKPLIESPDVVRFDPVTPDDVEQADLESDYCHHTFLKKCNGFHKLYVHVKDALLLKNAIFCTYWDEKVIHQKESYKNLNRVELANLLAPEDGSTVELISQVQREEVVFDPITGQPIPKPLTPPAPSQAPQGAPGTNPPQPPAQGPQAPPAPPGAPQPPVQDLGPLTEKLFDVEVRRYWRKGRPVVENCAPERFLVGVEQDSLDLDEARWCSYSMIKSRAELIALGYDEEKIEAIPVYERAEDDYVRSAREDVERYDSWNRWDNETRDASQDMFEIHRCYTLLDADGDGHEERYLIILGGTDGEVLLDYYEVPENPFSASSPFLMGHKFYGLSVYDKIREIADHKTRLLRMLEDNLDLTNNPRKKVIRGRAILEDLLINQPSGLWRVDQQDAVMEVPTQPIDQKVQQLLAYYDKSRTERVGVDPNAQSVSAIMPEESMNAAMERVISMKEEVVGLMIRLIAESGVKGMFQKLRGLLMRYHPRAELVQLRNKWTTINPGNWIERTTTSVVVGLGTGDRMRKAQALQMMLQLQQSIVQQGMMGILVSPERIGHTLGELVRVGGLGDPDDFLLLPGLLQDPRNTHTPRGQEMQRAQAFQQQMQQQKQQEAAAQQQAQQALQQALLQSQMQIEQLRAQTDMMEARMKDQQVTDAQKLDFAKFKEEMRLKWAELAAERDSEQAKVAAKVGADLMAEGAKQQGQEENDAREQAREQRRFEQQMTLEREKAGNQMAMAREKGAQAMETARMKNEQNKPGSSDE